MKRRKAYKYKTILEDIAIVAYSTIKALANETVDIAKVAEEDRTDDQRIKLRLIVDQINTINYTIHPLHFVSKKLLRKSEWDVVDYCIKQYKHAQDIGLVDKCYCYQCEKEFHGIK
jgi:hypothetical protein